MLPDIKKRTLPMAVSMRSYSCLSNSFRRLRHMDNSQKAANGHFLLSRLCRVLFPSFFSQYLVVFFRLRFSGLIRNVTRIQIYKYAQQVGWFIPTVASYMKISNKKCQTGDESPWIYSATNANPLAKKSPSSSYCDKTN